MPSDTIRVKTAQDRLPAMKQFMAHPDPESVPAYTVELVKTVVHEQVDVNTSIVDFFAGYGVTDLPAAIRTHEADDSVLQDYLQNGTSVVFTPEQTTAANAQIASMDAVIQLMADNGIVL